MFRNNELCKFELFWSTVIFINNRQVSITRNSVSYIVYLKMYLYIPTLYFEHQSSRTIHYDILYYYKNIILNFIIHFIILHADDTHRLYSFVSSNG